MVTFFASKLNDTINSVGWWGGLHFADVIVSHLLLPALVEIGRKLRLVG